nr:MAG TPA: hypothetical protein [Caudoviricetes sp.]
MTFGKRTEQNKRNGEKMRNPIINFSPGKKPRKH